MRNRLELGMAVPSERCCLPADSSVIIESEDGVIMGVKHKSLPISAVQFHPESLMNMKGDVGMRLIESAIRQLVRR